MNRGSADPEKLIILIAMSAFVALSLVFLGSVLTAKDDREMWWRAGLGAFCSLIAVVWFTIGPGNQGRMIRQFLHLLPIPTKLSCCSEAWVVRVFSTGSAW